MLLLSIGFLLGVCLLHDHASLPAASYLAGILLPAILALVWSPTRFIAGGLLGFAWAGLYAHWHQPPEIPELDSRTSYSAIGVVRSLPVVEGGRTRIQFAVESLNTQQAGQSGQWLLRLTWQGAPPVSVGQRWRLPLRIRPVRGYRNPGGWDYAGWLYRQGIRYSAYVATGESELLGKSTCCFMEKAREWLRERLTPYLADGAGGGMFLALTLGDKSGLRDADRRVLAVTGTSHLFAISGLHIGLSAAAFGGLLVWGWRRVPRLCGRVPALVAGALAGLLMATLYAIVSGFAIPAQRALVMFAAAVWVIFRRGQSTPGGLWAVALVAVLLWDPFAPLSAGFWLSFLAVVAILLLMPMLKGRHWLFQGVALQVGIGLALYPVLLFFGMPASWIGPMVNLLLVPAFGLLFVPAGLASVLLVAADAELGFLARWVAELLALTHMGLEFIAQQVFPVPVFEWNLERLALITLAVAMILMPPGIPARKMGALLLAAAHLPSPGGLNVGDFQATLLDVGQGLSMVLRTRHHVLVYDTGARYPSGFNLADAVLVPYLRHQGIDKIDMLVLSHGDNDHAGGAEFLVSEVPVSEVREGEPWRNPVPGRLCRAGENWRWDGVDFRFLQQRNVGQQKGNNASCVLLVENAASKLLIPGDIERRMEKRLIASVRPRTPIDAVVAPHHGSLSSSSESFVRSTGAGHVLYAVGARNRYGFPKQEVLSRWEQAGARTWRTDRDGAITLHFNEREGLREPETYHWPNRRYWHLANVAEVGL